MGPQPSDHEPELVQYQDAVHTGTLTLYQYLNLNLIHAWYWFGPVTASGTASGAELEYRYWMCPGDQSLSGTTFGTASRGLRILDFTNIRHDKKRQVGDENVLSHLVSSCFVQFELRILV